MSKDLSIVCCHPVLSNNTSLAKARKKLLLTTLVVMPRLQAVVHVYDRATLGISFALSALACVRCWWTFQ